MWNSNDNYPKGEEHVQVVEREEPAAIVGSLLGDPFLIPAFRLAAIDGVVGEDVRWVGHMVDAPG